MWEAVQNGTRDDDHISIRVNSQPITGALQTTSSQRGCQMRIIWTSKRLLGFLPKTNHDDCWKLHPWMKMYGTNWKWEFCKMSCYLFKGKSVFLKDLFHFILRVSSEICKQAKQSPFSISNTPPGKVFGLPPKHAAYTHTPSEEIFGCLEIQSCIHEKSTGSESRFKRNPQVRWRTVREPL